MPSHRIGMTESGLLIPATKFLIIGSCLNSEDIEATKPDDWDDEADGDLSASIKTNPAYMGKWVLRTIDNPDYRGPWIAKQISNPEYVEDHLARQVADAIVETSKKERTVKKKSTTKKWRKCVRRERPQMIRFRMTGMTKTLRI
ncbi:hypothetical protein GJ496_005702 [Pomphorhynchus laevis]|nr:hypothetical protein GJ496_005702 [Pomphorhynchus laevis]